MKKALLVGIFLHFLVVLAPLAREARLIISDLPSLWGKTNEQRRRATLGGLPDSIEDHRFIARCEREIPPDADVLIVSNSMINVYILNYYLYPRKTSVDESALGENYWIVNYFTPKALGKNSLEEPQENGAAD